MLSAVSVSGHSHPAGQVVHFVWLPSEYVPSGQSISTSDVVTGHDTLQSNIRLKTSLNSKETLEYDPFFGFFTAFMTVYLVRLLLTKLMAALSD